jgi:hypothetical protein
MGNEEDLEAALLDVANSDIPNYAAIARKHNIHRSTISRRARGVTRSRGVATSYDKKLLTDA